MADTRNFNNKRYATPLADELNAFTETRIKKLVDLITPCDKLLDIGCWDGYIIKKVIQAHKAKKVIGVDNSKSAIKSAVKKGLDVKFIRSADKRLPFKNGEFDCIVAGEIIEHIYDVNKFLDEINRVLNKGGQLIVTTPNLASLGARLSLILGKTPWMIENELGDRNAGHLRYFTFDSLDGLLSRHGFNLKERTVEAIHIGNLPIIRNYLLTKLFYKIGRGIIAKYVKNK